MLDVWYMLGFGVLGYVFKKLDYPLAPLVLALVLGDLAENALRQSLIMSQGSVLIFAHAPDRGRHHRGGARAVPAARRRPADAASSAPSVRGDPQPERRSPAMPVVAMTREMGSLGSPIAQEVARRLGYEFLRNDILRDAAREYRVRESRLVGVVEEAPGFVERLRRPRLRYRAYLEAAVLEAALQDRVVLVGPLVDALPARHRRTPCACASARRRRCGRGA